ncbi:MAG: flagellar biosynthetic protein FliR [Deltaproteobacteria bacterium]|nr:flagellar biosynthetic protein FliR [Deltaproteobacteria bacterium]
MIEAPTDTLAAFLLVLFRSAGLFLTVPVVGAKAVPMLARMAFAVIFACIAFFSMETTASVSVEQSLARLLSAVAIETFIGLAAGLSARFFVEALISAGAIAGLAMGMGFATTIDPLTGEKASQLAQFFSVAGIGFTIALGLHREAAIWLIESNRAFPPGSAVDIYEVAGAIVHHGLTSIVITVRLGYPILVAVTFGHAALGVIGRFAPQMSMQSMGLSFAIISGGYAVYHAVPKAAYAATILSVQALHSMR